MLLKEFALITTEDINILVSNSVSEDRELEYKQSLPRGEDDETREFLADISSFSNANGGDLIYGIRAKRDAKGTSNGLPEAAEGLANINSDQQILRLENILRDGVDPRINGIQIKAIEGFPNGPVIFIRVPKSWSAPHMVKFKGLSRFYSRNSAGKYQLDVREIRTAMISSDSLGEKISSFRTQRISKILSNEIPAPLERVAKLVVHLLPVRSFAESPVIDLRKIDADWRTYKIKPLGHPIMWGPPQYNSNGICITGGNSKVTTGYIQLFRNGAIEIVSARISTPANELIIGSSLEQQTLAANSLMQCQMRFELGPSLIFAVSLISVKGLIINPHPPTTMDSYYLGKPIEENVLLSPDVMIQEPNSDIGKLLKPSFDAIWQASGWPGSSFYDENGNRFPQQ